jgi:P-type Cu2+ transporter
MCCIGCAAVASLIAGSGLQGYYRHRDAIPQAAADIGSGAAEYLVFDAPDAQSEFVSHHPDGSSQVQLAIDGISCAACTWLLEHHLGRQPGVSSVNVNLAEQRASIRWQPGQMPLSELMGSIRSLGYRPHPYMHAERMQSIQQENRSALRRMGVAGIVQMQIGMFALALYAGDYTYMESAYRDYLRWASLILCVPVVVYSSMPFFRGAWRGVRHGAPGMDLPIAIAVGLAFIASVWFTVRGGGAVYYDSVAMFTFFVLLGRYLEMRARHRAGMVSGNVMSLIPAAATRMLADGAGYELVPIGRLRAGDTVLIRPGENVPADGRVVAGSSNIDESSISGESLPVSKSIGSPVSAGTSNLNGSLTVLVEATGMRSRLGMILELVDRAQGEKPAVVQLADRTASWFIIGVLLLSVVTGVYWLMQEPERALEIVLSVLVVSCPCALSLATPTSVTAAITTLKSDGFLVTRGHAIDALARADTVVFDKTGTLTTGTISLEEVVVLGTLDAGDCLRIAASLELLSEHPIAAAFDGSPRDTVHDFSAAPGDGISGRIGARRYRLGRAAFAFAQELLQPPADGKWVLLADESQALAWFRLGDTVRAEALSTVTRLRGMGLRVALLSGDANAEVHRIATQLGVDDWHAECSPTQKLEALKRRQDAGQRVIMVGDGINDVAVLAGADVSIAMAAAADVTRANADCLLLANDLERVALAVAMARRCRSNIRQNVVWAIAYNFAAIPFAAAGWVAPWLAAVGMSASSLVVIANALRLRKHASTADKRMRQF